MARSNYDMFLPGHVLGGRYRIRELIGRGGMARVYLATDVALQRDLALKILDAQYADDETFMRRFLREARLVARLEHPNILTVYDIGRVDQVTYIAMRYAEGGTLQQLLQSRSTPLDVGDAVRLAVQIASALEYAYSLGIVHRDVKPNNILLTNEQNAMLSDFGIARIVGTETLARPAELIGTPRYMSPEQITEKEFGIESDIYSLGVVLYEMLTLRLPFMGSSIATTLYQALYETPEAPRALNPSIPIMLDKAILRALAKDPADRYASAALFAAALERSIKGVSPDESWGEWQQVIMDRLLTRGQVAATELSDIPSEFRTYAIDRFVSENTQMRLSYIEDKSRIVLENAERVSFFLDKWDDVLGHLSQPRIISGLRRLFRVPTDENRQAIKSTLEISESLSDLFRISIQGNAVQKGKFVSDLFLDSTTLLEGLNVPSRLPCIFLLHTEFNDNDVTSLRSLLTDLVGPSQKVALLLVFGSSTQLEEIRAVIDRRMKQVYAHDVIAIGRDDLVSLAVTRDPQRALRSLILSHVDLLSVSVFVTTGPTPDAIFFGREAEMREITEQASNASFAIIGGRRVGKSSLLMRLHRLRLPAVEIRTLYHDCSTTPTYDDFLGAAIHNWRPAPPPSNPATFGELLESAPDEKPLVLLLDEADKLVPIDREDNWRLFSVLRSLANSGRAQIVFSGERTLRRALRDPKSPLFNFANEMLLGPLDRRAVEELVTLPMKQLEIDLEDHKAIVDRIWTFTSGHPNIVQRLCRRLIERLNERGTRRIILDDVNAIIENPQFQEVDFLQTYWEAASPLEKIITLVLSPDTETYSLKQVRQALHTQLDIHPSAKATKDALDRLVDLRSILKRSQSGYAFAVEAFPLVVANTTTSKDLLEVLVEQYEQEEA